MPPVIAAREETESRPYASSGALARGCQVLLETPAEVLELGDELMSDEDAARMLEALERGEF